MAEGNGPQPVSITLSVEELLVVLNTLEARAIPGLDADAWRGLNAEQQNLALSVASRALEARGLAEVDQYGALLLHRALLSGVGACAYPQRTAVIEHWPPGAADPQRFSAHVRDGDAVVHTVDGGLHTFALLAGDAELVDHLGAACLWSNNAAGQSLEITMPRSQFTQVCDASAMGSEAEALQVLAKTTKPTEAGTALVHTLASGPRISIVDLALPDAGQSWQQQSFTLIDDGERSWLAAPVTADPDSPIKARTASRADIGATLTRGL